MATGTVGGIGASPSNIGAQPSGANTFTAATDYYNQTWGGATQSTVDVGVSSAGINTFFPNSPWLQNQANTPLSFQAAEGKVQSLDSLLAQQQLQQYESGQLPSGTQAAIDLAYQTGQGALTAQLGAQGIDPQTSSQYAQGTESLAQQKSIATQSALDQLLQQYYQSQGQTLQAAEQLQMYSQFEQQLSLEYLQTWLQFEEFQQQLQEQSKQASQGAKGGGAGQLASGLGSMFGGGGGKVIVLGLMDGLLRHMGVA